MDFATHRTDPDSLDKIEAHIQELINEALRCGATDAAMIAAADIVVDDALADLCRPPQCDNYGLSRSCPPHVAGPQALRRQLESFSRAIVMKIDVPADMLYGSDRREVFHLLHQIAAAIEQSAVAMGHANARAYAGGSCRRIFCHDHLECRALSEKRRCRHPRSARPSMSGFGINVARLHEAAGWRYHDMTSAPQAAETDMIGVSALVLIH